MRTAYFNGNYLAEKDIVIPFRDASFRWGDGVYDMARTFNGEPHHLEEHVHRLYRSLAYVQIDPGISREEMIEISLRVNDLNRGLLGEGEDYWIAQRVSREVEAVGDEGWDYIGPTVLVECLPIPFAERAQHFRDGIEVDVSSIRRTPPECLSPRAKLNNYLNHHLADRDVKNRNPNAWALFLDYSGKIAEGTSNNFFMVRNGAVLTPREANVLPGITRQTAINLAKSAGIEVHEMDIDLFDAANAEEMFLTMTSMCICPVSKFNGRPVGGGSIPGPVTKHLMDAYVDLAGFDYIGQYLAHLPNDQKFNRSGEGKKSAAD